MYYLYLLFFIFTSMAIAYNPIGRQKSLRIGMPPILLNDFHNMITQKEAKPSSFKSLLSYTDNNDSLFVSPIFGLGYRLLKDDSVINSDIGFLVKGNKDMISFYLDSRIYMESHTHSEIPVWDGEMIESQNSNSGDDANLTYISYARFRGGMKADTKMGIFGFKRDPLHWGPGRNSGLMFSEHSIPFNHFYYTGTVGPLSVQSIYSKLAIDGNGNGRWIHSDRNLFAHRYTLNVNENLILGLSEQLIMFEQDDFSAVVPIVPLFMLKGSGIEDNNNGSLSFDISYNFSGIADIYSEFLIDDISEPTNLFNDFWKNKWGYLGGLHLSSSVEGMDLGVIVEYIRIEPWVYTHYTPNSAQAMHRGQPLGQSFGPNSQKISFKPYFWSESLFFSLEVGSFWKGIDDGSNVTDFRPDSDRSNELDMGRKSFLAGAEARILLNLELKYSLKNLDFYFVLVKNYEKYLNLGFISHW